MVYANYVLFTQLNCDITEKSQWITFSFSFSREIIIHYFHAMEIRRMKIKSISLSSYTFNNNISTIHMPANTMMWVDHNQSNNWFSNASLSIHNSILVICFVLHFTTFAVQIWVFFFAWMFYNIFNVMYNLLSFLCSLSPI